MKIRIVKADGKTVEVSGVAAVEIIECRRMRINRYDHFGSLDQVTLEMRGEHTGIFDANVPYPFEPVAMG